MENELDLFNGQQEKWYTIKELASLCGLQEGSCKNIILQLKSTESFQNDSVKFARDFGINEAILFEFLLECYHGEIPCDRKDFDSAKWCYLPASHIKDRLIFLTERQIRTSLNHLEEKKLIKSAYLNEGSFDRSKWYSITMKGFNELVIRS